MIRNVDIKDISDGRLYGQNDMVRADTGGCNGCSMCCRDMVDTIVLDPYDFYQLQMNLDGAAFDDFLNEQMIEMNVVDGLILPNLKRSEKTDGCPFLTGSGRCLIHNFRPGFCRLFPLGRFYEGRDFRYFLQVNECTKTDLTKVKVKKWLGIPNLNKYEDYIRKWHYFLVDTEHVLGIAAAKSETSVDARGTGGVNMAAMAKQEESIALEGEQVSENLRRATCIYIIQVFFRKPWDPSRDFYEQFEERYQAALQHVGIAPQNA